MKILVSGSFRDIDAKMHEPLRDAARELGKALALAGHTLLVGSESQDDVDPFVVEGFQSVDKAPSVEVHLQKGGACCYAKNAKVRNIWHRYENWDVTVLEVVRYNAEAVIGVLGVAAGFLTAALYMLAQITITGELDLPSTTADYSRVALIVSMAAVFASLYLDAAFSRFDLFKDSVMSGTYGKKLEGK